MIATMGQPFKDGYLTCDFGENATISVRTNDTVYQRLAIECHQYENEANKVIFTGLTEEFIEI